MPARLESEAGPMGSPFRDNFGPRVHIFGQFLASPVARFPRGGRFRGGCETRLLTKARHLSWRARVNGPGRPPPTGRPSSLITGTSSRIAFVRKISLAPRSASLSRGASLIGGAPSPPSDSRHRRITPGRILPSAGGVMNTSPTRAKTLVVAPSSTISPGEMKMASEAPARSAARSARRLGR